MNMIRREERALNPWRHWWSAIHDKSGEPKWARQVLDALDLHAGQSVLCWRLDDRPAPDEGLLLAAMADRLGPEGRLTLVGPFADPPAVEMGDGTVLRAPLIRAQAPTEERTGFDRILLLGCGPGSDPSFLAGLIRFGGRLGLIRPVDDDPRCETTMRTLTALGPVVATAPYNPYNQTPSQLVVILHRSVPPRPLLS